MPSDNTTQQVARRCTHGGKVMPSDSTTPRPWTIEQVPSFRSLSDGMMQAERWDILEDGAYLCSLQCEKRARSIVRDHNAHAALIAALQEALPLLEKLGDFIGNGEIKGDGSLGVRCDAILAIKDALALAEAK